MSNVLTFRPRPTAARLSRCEIVSVAGDLLAVLERLEDVSGRAALMARPAVEVERIVRNLREAVSGVEQALDCIGEGEQAAPA